MTQKQNPKFKIKEFEWFEMQTKVRQIIQEVLGPLQKRILQNSSVINKLKFDQGEDSKRVNQIILMVDNDPKVFETGIFANVQAKFENQAKKIEELSRQIQQQNKYVDQKFKILDVRMQESSEVLQNVATMRQRVAKEMQLQNDNINSIRTNLETMISDLNSDIRQLKSVTQKNLEKCEKEQYNLLQKILDINQQVLIIQQTLRNHQELHKDEGCRLEQHNEKLKSHQVEIDSLQESKILTKKLNDYIKDLQNQIRKYQFKLTTLSPLITQAQISECLYFVLPQKMKKRIAIHEYKKYFKLNREVLQQDYATIGTKFHGLQLLEQMQKRSTKEIIQMKRKKLLSMGVDIDHLTYQQREKYYSQLVLEDNFDEEDEEVRVAAKVDEKEILGVVAKHFKAFTEKVNEKILIQLKDSKQYLYDIEQQIQREIAASQTRVQKVQQRIETFQTNSLLQANNYRVQLQSFKQLLQDQDQQFHGFRAIQKSMYNFCSLVNHLQIQDEIDKQNISLMGIQESNVDQPTNRILQMDKKCFSCCGYPATTMNAFKMACLAYSPSPIIIDNVQYRRQELLQFTLNVLQGIKKNLQQNPKNPKQEINEGLSLDQRVQDNDEIGQIIDEQREKKSQTASKFRKSVTKKFNWGNNKHLSKSVNKNNSMRSDMLNVSVAFTELRKRNLTFLT